MPVERVARAHYRRQASLARRAAAVCARLWRQIDRGNIANSWRALVPQAFLVVSGAQRVAAASANGYTAVVMAGYDLDPDPIQVIAEAFAGAASDGRSLETLLYQPAITALEQVGKGRDVRRAMSSGLLNLDMIVRTQVADAGRVADGAAITAQRQLRGYVRMLVTPSCSRCVVLAGRVYRWNQGFQRHPRCDCRHIPTVEDADDLTTDPKAYFNSLSEADQDAVFTKAGAQAIRDGADIARTVNARRGMYTAAGKRFTTEATTRRGRLPGQARGPRLLPEQIYRETSDRDEAIRLLRLHGYIT